MQALLGSIKLARFLKPIRPGDRYRIIVDIATPDDCAIESGTIDVDACESATRSPTSTRVSSGLFRSLLESTIGIHREIREIKEKTWLPDLPGLPVHSGFN